MDSHRHSQHINGCFCLHHLCVQAKRVVATHEKASQLAEIRSSMSNLYEIRQQRPSRERRSILFRFTTNKYLILYTITHCCCCAVYCTHNSQPLIINERISLFRPKQQSIAIILIDFIEYYKIHISYISRVNRMASIHGETSIPAAICILRMYTRLVEMLR